MSTSNTLLADTAKRLLLFGQWLRRVPEQSTPAKPDTVSLPSIQHPNGPNQSVEEYLHGYTADTRELGYAVLVTGAWGSGKTYFLKRFLKRFSIRHLYVSLYGLSSTSQIDEEIFRQAHPVLASKGMRLLGTVAKGALKGTLKIDLSGDAHDSVSANAQLPTVDLKEFMNNPSGRVLVFDDLERCAIPKSQVLGYINAFVEHDGLKAIVVGDVNHIDEKHDPFGHIKEKLFGQTLEIQSDTAQVLNDIIGEIGDLWIRKFVGENATAVADVFALSQSNNLRLLRQAVGDLERLLHAVGAKEREHRSALVDVAYSVLALSFETRSGNLSRRDIEEAQSRWARAMRNIGNSKQEPTRFEVTEERYKEINFRSEYLSKDVLDDLFFRGIADPAKVQASLNRASPFTPKSDLPAWQLAWHGFEMSDDDYICAILSVRAEFDERKPVTMGVALHIVGELIDAARLGVFAESVEEMVALSKEYLDHLFRGSLMETEDKGFRAHSGLGYTGGSTSEFTAVLAHLDTLVAQNREDALPEKAETLLSNLSGAPSEFAKSLTIDYGVAGEFWRQPVLHLIDAKRFLDALLPLEPRDQSLVLSALRSRLEEPRDELNVERPWLDELRTLAKEAAKAFGPMTSLRLSWLLKDALEKPEPA